MNNSSARPSFSPALFFIFFLRLRHLLHSFPFKDTVLAWNCSRCLGEVKLDQTAEAKSSIRTPDGSVFIKNVIWSSSHVYLPPCHVHLLWCLYNSANQKVIQAFNLKKVSATCPGFTPHSWAPVELLNTRRENSGGVLYICIL